MARKPAGGDDDTALGVGVSPVAPTAATVAEGLDDTALGGAQTTQPRVRPMDSGLRTNKIGDSLRGANIAAFDAVERTRYQVLGELARGGLGRVMRARDPRTGRIVALKEILVSNPETLARFAREALVTANLQHPSIVPVYEVGRWPDGEPFYAMKLVNGRTLTDVIARAKTAAERMALLPHAIAVAEALAYAHSEHVIHRDLKPQNVLVGPYGETVVIDWGLARNIATGEEVGALTNPSIDLGTETVMGAVMGTPSYMPPEQAHGAPLDEGADVYALGALLYHMLSGARPYADATSVDEVVARVKAGPPRPLTELEAPPELIAIVDKAMARELAVRYRSALFLAEDLRQFQAGKLVSAHQYTSRELARRWLKKYKALLGVAIASLIAIVAVGTASVVRISRERDAADTARARAQASEQIALERFSASLEEQARQASLAGAPERAISLLLGVTHDTPTAGLLRGQARAAFADLVGTAPSPPRNGQSVALTADGTRLFVTSGAGKLSAWHDGTQTWTADGQAVQLSPDEHALLVIQGTGLAVLDAATGTQLGHWDLGEQANVIGWHPSGKRFAVGGEGGAVAFASLDGPLIPTEKHAKKVRVVAWRGELLASTGDDGAILIHGAKPERLVDTTGSIWAAAWLDGSHLVAGGADHVARVWNVETGVVDRRFDHGADIYGLVVGGTWLATYGDGPRLAVWQLAGGPPRELVGHRLAINNGAVFHDTLITSDELGTVITWDPGTGERLRTLPYEGLINGIAAKGDHVALIGEGRTRLWKLDPTAPFHRTLGHTARLRDLAIAGDTLWTTANDGTARSFGLDGTPRLVLGESSLAEPGVTGGSDPAMRNPPNPHGARGVTVAGDRVYTTYEDGRVLGWDARTGAQLSSWVGHTGRVRSIVVDGAVAYTAGDTTVRLWDVATGKERAHADLGAPAFAVALHGDTVATLNDGNQVHLFTRELAPGPSLAALGVDRLHELVFVGDRLLVGNPERLALVDLHTGQLVASAQQELVFTADVGPSTIAVGDAHGEIALHDRATLAPIRRWKSGDELVAVARLRPDGKLLATASGPNIKIWDTASGALVAERRDLPTLPLHLAWSADGTRLAIAGPALVAWIWDLSPATDVAVPCATPWSLIGATLELAPPDTTWCASPK